MIQSLVTHFDFDNENYTDLHYAIYVEDDHGCMSPVDTLTFDQVQTPLTVTYSTSNETECSEDVVVTSVYGGVSPYVIMVNDSVIAVNDTFTMPRGMNMLVVMDAHTCTFEETIDVMGMYVSRDTTINTYIGEETEFVDAESGIDTMLAVGMHELVYTIDCERTINVTVVEVPHEYAIKDVQGDSIASPIEGEIAKVMGTVTGVAAGEGFFVQDASEAWSGIWVEYTAVNDDGIEIGDAVSVVGEVAEVAEVTTILATEVMMEDSAMVITPVDVATPSEAEAEMYESVLVKVTGARATAADAGTGQWRIYYELTDDIIVNDWLFSYSPVDGMFYHVTGIVNGRLTAFKLEPRMDSDVESLPTKVNPDVANTFKVYPNPFNDRIYIDNSDKLSRIVVINIAGQRVIDVEYPEREIRTANLVSGVYLVNLFTDKGLAKTERIVKR